MTKVPQGSDRPGTISEHTEAVIVDAALAEGQAGCDFRYNKRTCPKCLWTYPDTDDHWFPDKDQCKECARTANAGLPSKPVVEYVDAKELLGNIVKGEVVQSSRLDHLLEHVRKQFGDERGIAAMAFSLYHDPRTKAASKVQILKMVTSLYAESSRQNVSSSQTLENMPTEHLVAVAQQMMLSMSDDAGG